MRSRRLALAFVLLVAARVVTVVVMLHVGIHGDGLFGYDPGQYHHVASEAGRAWRDFPVPFPPVAFLVMKLVNGATLGATLTRLAWSQLVCDLLVAWALAYGWGRRAAVTYLAFGLTFLVVPILYFRIDLASVAFAVWGLALLRRRRDIGAGVALALGVMTKVWPLALVPATLSERRPRAFAACAGAGLAMLAGWVAFGGTGGPAQVLTMRGAHGWQVESIPGSLWSVIAGGTPRLEVGAWRIGAMPTWSRTPLSLAMLGAVVVVWLLAARAPAAAVAVRDGVAPLTAVTAFLVLGPIVSPQYLLWIAPFAAIAWDHGERRIGQLALGACLVTTLLTTMYGRLLSGDEAAQLVLLTRNLLLVGVLGSGIGTLVTAARGGTGEGAAADAPGREPELVGAG